ncbi:tungsten formylmethanofuran dehydrogenase [Rhodoligotrophos ferricapiens]|uniref:tungsten formylmethanofuran dehydrogenase n=1 Tax=Rhodoligotrophos ferricapiens TaxID=3069264 RepID=UPI00315C92AA
MADVFVEGRPATLDEAVARATSLLAGARLPLIAGLGTDIAGIRASVRLAEAVGAAIDHLAAESVLRNASVMRDTGWMIASPGEVRRHADLIMFIGDQMTSAWPGMLEHIAPASQNATLVSLCAADIETAAGMAGRRIERLDIGAELLPGVLSGLRARLAGRKITAAPELRDRLDALAVLLKSARYGAIVWSAETLDELAIEMVVGLIRDLNMNRRFVGLPLAAGDNGTGALQACGWLTGYPMRTAFGGSAFRSGARAPLHDPWAYSADRLVQSGEADAVLWISAMRPAVPAWSRDLPMVALVAPGAAFARPPHVRIEVGIPGIDHGAVLFGNEAGGLIACEASAKSDKPSVDAVVGAIGARLEGRA